MTSTVDPAPHQRTRPELSDLALFAFAALALWFVRRALRRRRPKDRKGRD